MYHSRQASSHFASRNASQIAEMSRQPSVSSTTLEARRLEYHGHMSLTLEMNRDIAEWVSSIENGTDVRDQPNIACRPSPRRCRLVTQRWSGRQVLVQPCNPLLHSFSPQVGAARPRLGWSSSDFFISTQRPIDQISKQRGTRLRGNHTKMTEECCSGMHGLGGRNRSFKEMPGQSLVKVQ
jgi:hypothetical protein